MTAMSRSQSPQAPLASLAQSIQTAAQDVCQGFLDVTRNSMALLGTVLATGLILMAAHGDLRDRAEDRLLGWLLARQESAAAQEQAQQAFVPPAEPEAAQRVTAALPHELPQPQAKVAYWLSRKYRVAPEPLSVLVAEAFEIGRKAQLDPTLILAVMAIESRFNPFAQSPVGAQGLMQVLTRVHTDKYAGFGGQLAAFDPVSNLRVGVQVLQDCIRRAGSIEGGLKLYVGAITTDGSDYINKVMAEHLRIQSVALGKPMPTTFPVYRSLPVSAPDTTTPAEPVPAVPSDTAASSPALPPNEAPAVQS